MWRLWTEIHRIQFELSNHHAKSHSFNIQSVCRALDYVVASTEIAKHCFSFKFRLSRAEPRSLMLHLWQPIYLLLITHLDGIPLGEWQLPRLWRGTHFWAADGIIISHWNICHTIPHVRVKRNINWWKFYYFVRRVSLTALQERQLTLAAAAQRIICWARATACARWGCLRRTIAVSYFNLIRFTWLTIVNTRDTRICWGLRIAFSCWWWLSPS